MVESLEEIMRSKDAKNLILGVIRGSYVVTRFTRPGGTQDEMMDSWINSSLKITVWFLRNCKLVEKQVMPFLLEKHGRPLPCTSEDIIELLIEHIGVFTREDLSINNDGIELDYHVDERNYKKFYTSLLVHCGPLRRNSPFLVLRSINIDRDKLPFKLWESRHFMLNLVDIGVPGYDPDNDNIFYGGVTEFEVGPTEKGTEKIIPWLKGKSEGKQSHGLYAQVEGYCSRRALVKFEKEIKLVVNSAIRSLRLTGHFASDFKPPPGTLAIEGENVAYSVTSELELTDKGKEEIVNVDELELKVHNSVTDISLPNKTPESVYTSCFDSFDFLRKYINYYYLEPTKKDSLDRRLRNAMHLLVEADRQEHNSVALALSFSAIESLICSKKDGIADELSRNVATLLEPEASERIEAIKAVKKLYDSRSRLLHGVQIEFEHEVQAKVRILAAGCLHAVTEWITCNIKMGKEKSVRADLFSEIEAAKVSGVRLVGISEYSRNWLPSLRDKS
jgi:hypothetical protein